MWAVVVKPKGNNRIIKKFTDKEEALKYYKKVLKLEGNYKVIVGFVSLTEAFPPDEEKTEKKRKKELWCPYCNEYRRFKKEENRTCCEVCGISTEDFWTKTYNNLWEKTGKAYFRRKA